MYAEYSYYTDSYGGRALSEDEFPEYAERASDFLNYITRKRLVDNLPSDQTDLGRIKRACCAVAEKMKAIDKRKEELSGSASGGVLKSMSSGGESVSFELSEIDRAIVGGEKELNQYLYNIAKVYLSMVGDDKGFYYLYWGI